MAFACNKTRTLTPFSKHPIQPNPRLAKFEDSLSKEQDTLSDRILMAEIQLKQLKRSATFIKQGALITETSADPVHQ